MNGSRALVTVVLGIAGLVILGMVAIWVVRALLGLTLYLVVGGIVVLGAVYLSRRVRRSLSGSRNRQVRR